MMLLALQRYPELRNLGLSRLDMANTEKCWTECAHQNRLCNDRLQYSTALTAGTYRFLMQARSMHICVQVMIKIH